MKTIRLKAKSDTPITPEGEPSGGETPPPESPNGDGDQGERHRDPPPANTHPLFKRVGKWQQ